MRIRFQRHLQVNSTPNLIPLIDVVLQLVVFFMITTTFTRTPGIDLKLPQSSTSEATKTSELVITVVSHDEIYVNKDKYEFTAFDQAMAGFTKEERDKFADVIIEGDENIPYQLLVNVLDVLRKNGFNGANLKTTHVQQALSQS